MTTLLGVGMPNQNATSGPSYYQKAIELLMPSCWHNWLFDQRQYIWPPYYPTVWAMVRNADSERAIALSHYGVRRWHFGTEPNNTEQSNTEPAIAADFSNWWRANGAGEMALPGIIVMEPDSMDGIGWLNRYLDAGGVVPDYWTVSNYAWVPDQWDGNLKPFRALLKKRNVERPLIVKECASWSPEIGAQKAIMDHVYKRVYDGTICEAYWYSTYDPFGPLRGSDLLTLEGDLTALGLYYRALRPIPLPPPEGHTVHLPLVLG